MTTPQRFCWGNFGGITMHNTLKRKQDYTLAVPGRLGQMGLLLWDVMGIIGLLVTTID